MRKLPLVKWLGRWPWLVWPVAFAGGLVVLTSSVGAHVLLDRLDGRDVAAESLAARVVIYSNGALVMELFYAWNLRPFPVRRGIVAIAAYAVFTTICVAQLRSSWASIAV